MRTPLFILGLALLVSVAATAEARRFVCSVPLEEWQPAAVLAEKLGAEGTTVRSIRVNHGCYRVVGWTANGAAYVGVFDPRTLAALPIGQSRDGEEESERRSPRSGP